MIIFLTLSPALYRRLSEAMLSRPEILKLQELLSSYCRYFEEDAQRLQILNKQLAEYDPYLCNRKNLPGHLTASALVFDRQRESFLLIYHNSLKRWLQPGGHMDAGETPEEGALRELTEEVGVLTIEPLPWHRATRIPLDVDSHIIPANDAKGEPEHLHHDFQYIFELTDRAAINLQPEEVSAFQWSPLESLSAGQFGKRLARVASKMIDLSLV